MKDAPKQVQDALIDRIIVRYNNRVSQQLLNCMRDMIDHTYLTDLIDALESISDFENITEGWDSNLVTCYPVKPFQYGPFKNMQLWHAHFPLSGSAKQVVSGNLLKKRKLNSFVNESFQKKNIDSSGIEKIIGRHFDKIIGLNAEKSKDITSDWLIFLPTNDGIQYLCACEHLTKEEEEVLALALRAKHPRLFGKLEG